MDYREQYGDFQSRGRQWFHTRRTGLTEIHTFFSIRESLQCDLAKRCAPPGKPPPEYTQGPSSPLHRRPRAKAGCPGGAPAGAAIARHRGGGELLSPEEGTWLTTEWCQAQPPGRGRGPHQAEGGQTGQLRRLRGQGSDRAELRAGSPGRTPALIPAESG